MGEVQRFAAVDVPLLAGNEFAERRAEKDDGGRDILDVAHPPQHVAVEFQPLLGFDRIVAHALGLDGAGGDAIETNAEFRPLERQRLHHRQHAAARRGGMHETAQPGADARRHEHDRAAVLQHEMIGGGLGHLPGPDQVVADHRFKARVIELACRCHKLAAGIVDQHVEPAERVLDPQHRGLDLLRQADVGRNGERLAAEIADDRGAILDRTGAATQHHDTGAAARHLDGSGAAHPGSTAGHQRDPVLEEVRREAHVRKLLHGGLDH